MSVRKQKPDTRKIVVIFSVEGLAKIVNALAVTKACHGEFFMEDSKAMCKIVMAIAAGKDSVLV